MNVDFLAATILHEKLFIIKPENFPSERILNFLPVGGWGVRDNFVCWEGAETYPW